MLAMQELRTMLLKTSSSNSFVSLSLVPFVFVTYDSDIIRHRLCVMMQTMLLVCCLLMCFSALVQFFTLFPELKDNEFYITGEVRSGLLQTVQH